MSQTPRAIPTRYVALAGLAFGIFMGAFFTLRYRNGYYGLLSGSFCGLSFGFGTWAFIHVAMSTTKLEMGGHEAQFEPGEVLVHSGPANHFKGAEAVGGKLFLTNRRLRFRSHRLNVQAHDESYAVDSVVSVELARTLGIVPNGMLVHFRDGRQERFVVMARKTWVELIERQARLPS